MNNEEIDPEVIESEHDAVTLRLWKMDVALDRVIAAAEQFVEAPSNETVKLLDVEVTSARKLAQDVSAAVDLLAAAMDYSGLVADESNRAILDGYRDRVTTAVGGLDTYLALIARWDPSAAYLSGGFDVSETHRGGAMLRLRLGEAFELELIDETAPRER